MGFEWGGFVMNETDRFDVGRTCRASSRKTDDCIVDKCWIRSTRKSTGRLILLFIYWFFQGHISLIWIPRFAWLSCSKSRAWSLPRLRRAWCRKVRKRRMSPYPYNYNQMDEINSLARNRGWNPSHTCGLVTRRQYPSGLRYPRRWFLYLRYRRRGICWWHPTRGSGRGPNVLWKLWFGAHRRVAAQLSCDWWRDPVVVLVSASWSDQKRRRWTRDEKQSRIYQYIGRKYLGTSDSKRKVSKANVL